MPIFESEIISICYNQWKGNVNQHKKSECVQPPNSLDVVGSTTAGADRFLRFASANMLW